MQRFTKLQINKIQMNNYDPHAEIIGHCIFVLQVLLLAYQQGAMQYLHGNDTGSVV